MAMYFITFTKTISITSTSMSTTLMATPTTMASATTTILQSTLQYALHNALQDFVCDERCIWGGLHGHRVHI